MSLTQLIHLIDIKIHKELRALSYSHVNTEILWGLVISICTVNETPCLPFVVSTTHYKYQILNKNTYISSVLIISIT